MVILKKYNLYLLVTSLIYFANIFAIKINGSELNDIIKPYQSFIYEVDNDLVSISMKDENINLESLKLDNAEEIKLDFDKLNKEGENNNYPKRVEWLMNFRNSSVDCQSRYCNSDQPISIKAGNNVNILNSLLKAPSISVFCKKIDINCYSDTNIFQIESTTPDSLCNIIRFKFKKDRPFPAFLKGKMDLENNLTEGSFIAGGIETIEIVFSSKLFTSVRRKL